MKTKGTLKIRAMYLTPLRAVSAAKNTPRIPIIVVPISKAFMLCCRMADSFGGSEDGMRMRGCQALDTHHGHTFELV
jgi:hypothetical protein